MLTTYDSLNAMMNCAYDPVNDRMKRIVLPYFGTLIFNEDRQSVKPPLADLIGETNARKPQEPNGRPNPNWQNTAFSGISYDGPFLPESDAASWMLGLGSEHLPDANAQQWSGTQPGEVDWSWMFADLPPNSGL